MDYAIRHIRRDEWPLLEDFLYEAIFVPEGFEGEIPRSVIYDDPKCRASFEGFGALPDDRALVAVVDGRVVGACWVRTTDEYGHIDNQTPSFAISLYEPFRGQGIGTAMMYRMLRELREAGYARASLSVQKENPALRLYERLGFRIIGDGADESEWMMVCDLEPAAIRQANADDVESVYDLVHQTIRAVYPSCYEPAVVEAFIDYHNREAIAADIAQGKVYVLERAGRILATGSIDGGCITRVYVRQDQRGNGYGSAIMDELEALMAAEHTAVSVDASAIAESFYQHRGYHVVQEVLWEIDPTDDLPGTSLLYKVMEKELPRA